MAVVNSGFDGTVTETRFAQMMRASGLRDSVATSAAWKVTQGAGRQVSVAAGIAYATGVVSVSDAAQTANLATPVNGQWHLVVRRVNWTSNTVTVETIPHTVTTTTVPTVAPDTFPTFNDSEGVLLDQKLAWAWVRSTDTTVTVFDLRVLNVNVLETREIQTFRRNSLSGLNAITGLLDGDRGYVSAGSDKGDYSRSGGAWLRTSSQWVTWAPTLQNFNALGSGGVATGEYKIENGFCYWLFKVTFGTGAVTPVTSWGFSMPTTIRASLNTTNFKIGEGLYRDASVSNVSAAGNVDLSVVYNSDTGYAGFRQPYSGSAAITDYGYMSAAVSGVPTPANGDYVTASGSFPI